MPELYCVRALYGKYTEHFLKGGYTAIGWLSNVELSTVKSRDEIYPLYKKDNPDDTSNLVIGQQVGQITRFLLDIKAGDFVILPASDTEYIYYGIVEPDPSYFFANGEDGCPYLHRRKVKWNTNPFQRSAFSVPFQNTIRSSLTVFKINHKVNFFETIERNDLVPAKDTRIEYDYYKSVLTRILELDPKEFEILITHLLSAIGFEGAEHTGKPGDGGVDATGELNIAGMAKVKIFVQAKRYQLDKVIKASDVKALRQSIPRDGQGAFITTSKFDKKCKEIALDSNFARIGLINGNQLVELLAEHWEDIPTDFKDKLGLKLGLILA